MAYIITETFRLPSRGLEELVQRSEKQLKKQARKDVERKIAYDREEKQKEKEEKQKKANQDTEGRGVGVENRWKGTDTEKLVAEEVLERRQKREKLLQKGVKKLMTSHPNLRDVRKGGQDNEENAEGRYDQAGQSWRRQLTSPFARGAQPPELDPESAVISPGIGQ